MRSRAPRILVAGAVLALVLAGCGSKGTQNPTSTGDTVNLGASMSLSGSLEKEGKLTQQGYDYCVSTVNAKGGIPVGGRSLRLHIDYQDDQSQPDTAGQLVDQFNDKGYKLILGPYGSATTGAAMAVVERNGQVMVDSSGADDTLFNRGYRRTFAVLSPASVYAASIVDAVNELATPKPRSIVFLSADDGFSKTVAAAGEARAKSLGLTVLPGQQFPAGATDVSSALTRIKSGKPEVIVGSVHLAEGIAIIKQAAELAVTPTGASPRRSPHPPLTSSPRWAPRPTACSAPASGCPRSKARTRCSVPPLTTATVSEPSSARIRSTTTPRPPQLAWPWCSPCATPARPTPARCAMPWRGWMSSRFSER